MSARHLGGELVEADMDSTNAEQEIMKSTPTIRGRLGSIDRLVLSCFDPVLGEGGVGSSLFGVPYQDSWVDAFVYTEKGEFYWIIRADRNCEPDQEMRWVFSTMDREGAFMAPRGVLSNLELKSDTSAGLRYVTPDAAQAGYGEATYTDKTVTWKEEGLLEISGRIAGPGVQVMLPVRRDGKASAQIYCHQQYLVEGTIRGERVRGFVLLERNFETVTWFESGWVQGQHGGYLMFGNEFEDGSVEMGFVYCGTDKRGAIVFNEKGENLVNTNDVQQQNSLNENGILTDALYTFDGNEQWQFKIEPATAALDRRKPVDKTKPDVVSTMSFGHFTRVGDTRKRVRWWTQANAGSMW